MRHTSLEFANHLKPLILRQFAECVIRTRPVVKKEFTDSQSAGSRFIDDDTVFLRFVSTARAKTYGAPELVHIPGEGMNYTAYRFYQYISARPLLIADLVRETLLECASVDYWYDNEKDWGGDD